ncbi:MAG: hypothetical protein AVDCRST_MAG93-3978 [uncultured Chloroflexia bacterium]|uniref:Uncharacterized protein n=1 Tax=uncultured Chloroflexia bacterium TaxID=1672391 RepID=A0A6J4JZT2_9CHLR|nr:MAG: hypothetical protein AVDCRST_MAG93-3978 [uncultured Chloroflexia bacterium]
MDSGHFRRSWSFRRWHTVRHVLTWMLCVPLLAGCLLLSGAQQSADRAEDAGNVSVQFVSAEGTEVREVTVADAATNVLVTVFARSEQGQLRIEILDPQGSATLVIEGTPEEQVARATVATDDNGVLRYRIKATGARRGGFQILYQPAS